MSAETFAFWANMLWAAVNCWIAFRNVQGSRRNLREAEKVSALMSEVRSVYQRLRAQEQRQ